MNIYLDIAISLLLIFVVFSVIVYVIQEMIAINLEYRGKMLWNSLAQALDGIPLPSRAQLHRTPPEAEATLTTSVFGNSQIRSLMKGNEALPSYIHSLDFARAVIEVVAAKAASPGVNKLADFISGLNVQITTYQAAHPGKTLPPVYDIFKGLAAAANGIEKLETEIGDWYDRYMARVSGWYKSHVVLTVRLIALGVTLFFNINVVHLVRSIAGDTTMRTNLLGIAERVADHPEQVTDLINKDFDARVRFLDSTYKPRIDSALAAGKGTLADDLRQQLSDRKQDEAKSHTDLRIHSIDSLTRSMSAVNLPIGWHLTEMSQELKPRGQWDLRELGLLVLGWLIAAGCLSMGAPFWFSLLIQVVNIRRAGLKPGGDKKE
jgi:hypothetical protein